MSETLWDVAAVIYVVVGAAFAFAMVALGFWVTDRAVRARGASTGWAFIAAMVGGVVNLLGGWMVLLPYLFIGWALRRFRGSKAAAIPGTEGP